MSIIFNHATLNSIRMFASIFRHYGPANYLINMWPELILSGKSIYGNKKVSIYYCLININTLLKRRSEVP